MASLRELRTRLASVQDTMKITNAMYLISSSKLRKARAGRDKVAPYFDTLQATISDVLAHAPELENVYFESRERREKPASEKKRAFIVISSDKGLAGAYNHNVFKLLEPKLEEESAHDTLILVGHMAQNYFHESDKLTIDRDQIYPATDPTVYRAREISENVIEKYKDGEFDEVYVVYTKMINSLSFNPEIVRVLPLTRIMFEDAPEKETMHQVAVFSPSEDEVLNSISPNYVKGLIYGAIVESFACEQNSRMTAMQSATDNAKEMIANLSLMYNRVRQANITQEITEIVAGANAGQ